MTNPLRALLFATLFTLAPLAAAGADAAPSTEQRAERAITVTIDYGELRPPRTVKSFYREGMSALELLQRVADVKTHRVNSYLFVKSIDGVESVKGKMGWFYTIDGKPTKTLAHRYLLSDAEQMRWSYKIEACY